MKRLLTAAIALSTLGALPYNPAKADISKQYEGEGISSCKYFYFGRSIIGVISENARYCVTKKGWVYAIILKSWLQKIGGVDVTYKMTNTIVTIKTNDWRQLIIYSCEAKYKYNSSHECKNQVKKSVAKYVGKTFSDLPERW